MTELQAGGPTGSVTGLKTFRCSRQAQDVVEDTWDPENWNRETWIDAHEDAECEHCPAWALREWLAPPCWKMVQRPPPPSQQVTPTCHPHCFLDTKFIASAGPPVGAGGDCHHVD